MNRIDQQMNRVKSFSRRLYEHGFSTLAFLLMLLVFAISGAEQNEIRNMRALGAREEQNQTAVRNWREVQSEWLTEKATELTRQLRAGGIHQVTVYSRVKSEESALEKASRRGVDMMELNDLYGMRVVVSNELDVYLCLNQICSTYEIIPGTMKNYIVSPKASGYQSVHVVAQVDDNRVEFQIRTEAMHLSAEAEHEAYKARMRAA